MYKPLRSGVVLRASEAKQSSSGLIIASQVNNIAEVIRIGPEVKEVKIGDQVRFDLGSAVKLDDLLLCREADILCVVEA